jgi:hypothetical protein
MNGPPTRPTLPEAIGLVLLVLALMPIVIDVVLRKRTFSLQTLFLVVFSIGLFGTLLISAEPIFQGIGIVGALLICGFILRHFKRENEDG